MRLGFILDHMHRAVRPDRVETGHADLEKYRGLLPYLRMEQKNARYVYDLLKGNPVSSFELLHFKDGQKPNMENIKLKSSTSTPAKKDPAPSSNLTSVETPNTEKTEKVDIEKVVKKEAKKEEVDIMKPDPIRERRSQEEPKPSLPSPSPDADP